MTPYEEASNYLLTNLETVCSHLFPGGKREGANFIVGSIAGQAGRSFSIALEPPTKRGLYKDFANGTKVRATSLSCGKLSAAFRKITTLGSSRI